MIFWQITSVRKLITSRIWPTRAHTGLMDPALQKLSELPCSDSLPRILLTYADYLDCAESGKAQGDKHKGCDEPLSAMLKKIGYVRTHAGHGGQL